MELKISNTLSLPLNAVTQKFAFLGRTGSGKTYAASKLAEEMLAAKAQVVVLDAVGVWYGLRIAADGVSPGISIPVFGGLHGDVPLDPSSGQYIADLVVDKTLSVVLDVSQFEHDSDKAKFAEGFASRFFYRKKAAPSAVHVFLEECQEFVPQNIQKGEERMLHSFNRMWKLGRNFGIGGSLISQRPQEVSKKALNLTECMFAFQMTGPHERKTIRDWIAEKGLDDIVDELPKLSVGQAHVWSPQWLKVSETYKISKKSTFNASSTPEVGQSSVARELAPIDLAKIRTEMAATIERAKQEDPRELKRKIAELQRQLNTAPKPIADEAAIQRAVETSVRQREREHDQQLSKYREIIEKLQSGMASIGKIAGQFVGIELPKERHEPLTVNLPARPVTAQRTLAPRTTAKARESDLELSGPEKRILDAIAWLNAVGVDDPEQTAVAFLAGYTIGGGAFNNPRGRLSQRGLVQYVPGDRIRLTDAGQAAASAPDTPLDERELQRMVMERLPGPERKILQVLIDSYPDSISSERCAQFAGYAEGGGAFNNPRGRLRSLGLIEYPSAGMVVARPVLFLREA